MAETTHLRLAPFLADADAAHVARTTLRAETAPGFHDHDFPEIFWIEAGRGAHAIGGDLHPLRAGDLWWLRPGDAHALRGEPDPGLTLVNLAFPATVMAGLRDRHFPPAHARDGAGRGRAQRPTARRTEATGCFFWPAGPAPYHARLEPERLRRLSREAERLAADPTSTLRLERFLLDLILDLLAMGGGTEDAAVGGEESADRIDGMAAVEGEAARPTRGAAEADVALSTHAGLGAMVGPRDGARHETPLDAPHWLREAVRRLRRPEHLVEGAAAMAHLTHRHPAHVGRLLKRYYGRTTTELVNEARLRHAAGLLVMSDEPVLAVALASGFSHQGHFHARFKDRFGLTPLRYRRHHQAIANR